MTLITAEEFARGACIGVFGGLAGVCTLAFPGSPMWLAPAALALTGCALTVPELRQEAARALPLLSEARPLIQGPANVARGVGEWVRTGQRMPAGAAAAPQRGAQSRHAAPPATEGAELFDALESSPHRLIIGHTRGGKTTLVHHMATAWAARGERVLVADPDAAPGLWPGCEVRGHGDNVAAIGELLQVVAGEVETRRQLRAQGVRRFEPLHFVVDEAQDVLPVLPGGLELFEDVARRGGKLNIRMTVGVQDKQVKTLGLEGKSEVLRNLQVADVLKNREGRRVAVLRDAETGQKVSMPIPALLDPESLIVEAPRPAMATTQNLRPVPRPAPTDAPLDLSDLLNDLLAQPVTSASESVRNAPAVPVTVTGDGGNGNGNSASVTVGTGEGGPVVKVYAQALAAGRNPARRGRGLDMKARRARAAAQRQVDELARAYADARAAGVPSFRAAYADLGGNRDKALAAWQAAGNQKESTRGA